MEVKTVMKNITFEIKEKYGKLNEKDWSLEVNRIAWNKKAPKIDIRAWDSSHEKMSKGITLTDVEAKKLLKILTYIYKDK